VFGGNRALTTGNRHTQADRMAHIPSRIDHLCRSLLISISPDPSAGIKSNLSAQKFRVGRHANLHYQALSGNHALLIRPAMTNSDASDLMLIFSSLYADDINICDNFNSRMLQHALNPQTPRAKIL
jgi:hypothetical protein